MNPDLDFSPSLLSYVGALRGVRPRRPGDGFVYAEVVSNSPARLVCLAASNPEGQFYGLVVSAASKTEGEKLAFARGVSNIKFIEGKLQSHLAQIEKGNATLPPLNYLCCDERQASLTQTERAALFALAEAWLAPGGLFAYGYRAYDANDGALRFLVRELAPEMDAAQAREFLRELKQLGPFYFCDHRDAAAKLDDAITTDKPERFFADYQKGDAHSRSFDTIVALRPRNFNYAGDANIGMNYVERSAPASAHQLILDCRDNHLYEPIKDFALNRQERCDIWCRQPAPASANLPELFGSFVYGIACARADVPKQIETESGTVDLGAQVFEKLADLMTLMPVSIGDFLAHPTGKDFAPADVVGAIQILVACGLARPMRGHYRSNGINIEKTRLTGTFNQYLDKIAVNGDRIWMSSPVAGGVLTVSARDALVMQAINRVGLANSVSALLPELERLAKDPASAARVMDVAEPTPEIATNMIKDAVAQSMVQWYAYGLLAAA